LIWVAPLAVAVFFFQAEDGIRDFHVTGVQTCALPISPVGPAHGGRPCAESRSQAKWSSMGPRRHNARPLLSSRGALRGKYPQEYGKTSPAGRNSDTPTAVHPAPPEVSGRDAQEREWVMVVGRIPVDSFAAVRSTTAEVMRLARHVHIDTVALDRLAHELASAQRRPAEWDDVHHFRDGGPLTVQYLLV